MKKAPQPGTQDPLAQLEAGIHDDPHFRHKSCYKLTPRDMNPFNVYWHLYGRHQIKPELRGNMVYLLEIPTTLGAPVLHHIYDPRTVAFPISPRNRVSAIIKQRRHGIIYNGVSKEAVCDMLRNGPQIHEADPRFVFFNRQIVCQGREFFLIDPEDGFETMPDTTRRLLCGQNIILGRLYLRPAPLPPADDRSLISNRS